jgi:hypothetical protein
MIVPDQTSSTNIAPRPARRRLSLAGKVIATALVVVPILGLVGVFGVDGGGYIPSTLVRQVCFYLAIVGAITGVSVGIRNRGRALARSPFLSPFPPLRYVLYSGTLAGILAASFAGLAWPLTVVFGQTQELTVTVTGWHDGVKVCSGPDIAEAAPLTAPLCLDRSWRVRLPPGTKLFVTGPASMFGMAVQHINVFNR